MSNRPPKKLTNDTGLSHVVDPHYYLDNVFIDGDLIVNERKKS